MIRKGRLNISRYLLSPEDDPINFIERVVNQDETLFTTLTQSQNAEQTMEASLIIPS